MTAIQLRTVLVTTLLLTGVCAANSAPVPSKQVETTPLLDLGYHQMYNLHFPEAHATFAQFMALHPKDPMGPVSDAAAYLFSEFNRTGVLNMDLFTNDNNYLHHKKDTSNPDVKKAFDRQLDKTNQLADAVLAQHPQDATALFAKTLAYGLHADYACMIERHDLQGFRFTRSGSTYAHQLLGVDPHAYDAYLAVGMENYILGLKAAPVRWLLQLAGGETNKALGVKDLELTATQGHYLQPLAKLLLAVAAVRNHNKPKARELLASLAHEFPNNPLYAQQLAKLS